MSNNDTTKPAESGELQKRPLSQMRYNALVFLGVLINFFLMILVTSFSNLSLSNPIGYTWFLLFILMLIPLIGTLVFTILVSITMPRKYTLSPVYVMLFTIVPAYLVGAYVNYEMYSQTLIETRFLNVMGYLFITSWLFFVWILISTVVMQPIVRGLVGAYAERDDLKGGTIFFKSSISLESILEMIEDAKWLPDLCSMDIVDRKEEKSELKLRLNKHETNYYVALFARRIDNQTFVALTPYELDENLAKKRILVSDDCKNFLQPQMKIFLDSFKLTEISGEPNIVYESVNYAMSPARFPAIVKYGKQISVAAVVTTASMTVVTLYSVGAVKEVQTAVGIVAVMVALGSTAINLLSRK